MKSRTAATLTELLYLRAEQTPDQLCYRYLKDGATDEVPLTYSGLLERALQVAGQLAERVKPGDRVLICHNPSLDYIAAFFGCVLSGTVAVPVYPPRMNQKMDRIRSIVSDVGAKVALVSQPVLEMIRPTLAEEPILQSIEWVVVQDSEKTSLKSRILPKADSLAFIQYTSGSTSDPKGVMLSHSNILANLEAIHEGFELSQDSVGISWLPPYHDMGMIGGVLEPVYGGFPIVLMSPFSFLQRPLRWLQAIHHYRCTATAAPNFAYEACVKRVTDEQAAALDLSCLKVMACGAEPIRIGSLEAFAKKFAVSRFSKDSFYPCYGLAESTLMVTGGKRGKTWQINGDHLSCGHERPGHAVKIVNPNTHIECEEGVTGEIWASGPSIAGGYWNRPEESERTFGAKILGDPENTRYLRTGDLGYLRHGEIYVTGRIKDLVIVRGRNLYPQDIELTVREAHPALSGNGAAFSVDVGEENLVIVQEVDRKHRDLDLMRDVLPQVLENLIEVHQVKPYAISFVKQHSIPLTSSGKIQRQATRAHFLNSELEVLATWKEG